MKIEKEKTQQTPYILVDENNGYMKFEGESYCENVPEFYKDVVEWLKSYVQKDFGSFTFDCKMKYFNSSTAKLFLEILILLDNAVSNKNKVVVNWIVSENNEIMIEHGEDFALDVTKLTFNLVIQKV